MSTYTVTRHRASRNGEQWGITALTSHGKVAAGTVTRAGDSYDVRTDAGAKCFRGTDSYAVRMAAVEQWRGGRSREMRMTKAYFEAVRAGHRPSKEAVWDDRHSVWTEP